MHCTAVPSWPPCCCTLATITSSRLTVCVCLCACVCVYLQLERGDSSAATLSCLASDSRYGLLAAGAGDGRVTVYKYTAPVEDKQPVMDLSKCWEAQPAFLVGIHTHTHTHHLLLPACRSHQSYVWRVCAGLCVTRVCIWLCVCVSIGLTEHTDRGLARVGLTNVCVCVCMCVCVSCVTGWRCSAVHGVGSLT